MTVFVVRWGVAVSAGTSVLIGVEIVTCNGGGVALIKAFDNTTVLPGKAAVVPEAITVTKIFVIAS